MSRLLPCLLAVLMLVPAAQAVPSSEPRLAVELQPTRATIGQPVEVRISVTLPSELSSATPRFPVWNDAWGDAEVLSSAPPRRKTIEDGEVRWSQVVRIAAFQTGRISLPPRQVVIPEAQRSASLRTPASLALVVVSVLPKGADVKSLKPRPTAPLHPLPWGRRFWWALTLGLLGVFAAAWWGRRRAAAVSADATEAPFRPPYEELRAGLETLASINDSHAFHVELSRLLRRYLGRALTFPAIESTTTEIRRRLVGVHLTADVIRDLVSLLRRCDEVKFARRRHEEGLNTLARQALSIGEQIERHLHPVVSDSSEEQAA